MRNLSFDAGDIKLFVDGKEIGTSAYVEVEFEEPEEKATPFSYSASGSMTIEMEIVSLIVKRPDGTVWEIPSDGKTRKLRDNGRRRRHKAIQRQYFKRFKSYIRRYNEFLEGRV